MANKKCLKCGKVFVTEAPSRLEMPVCAECLVEYNKWLQHETLDNRANEDCNFHLKKWVGKTIRCNEVN